MEWSNEFTLRFLEIYQAEPIIWNPLDKCHKNKSKIHDAWTRIAHVLGKPVAELKSKQKSLMATFRMHLRRKKASIKSGAGNEDVYKPIWFAYEMMANFLTPVYESEITINTEENSPHPEEQTNERTSLPINNEKQNVTEFTTPKHQQPKRRQQTTELDEAQKKIKLSLETLNNVLLKKKEDDECDLYGKLLAKKLRCYSEQDKHQLMYQIDGLLLAKPPQQQQQCIHPISSCSSYSLPSPVPNNSTQFSSPSSSQSPAYIILKRPSSTRKENINPHDLTSTTHPPSQKKNTPTQNTLNILSQEVILPGSQHIIYNPFNSDLYDEPNES